MKRFIALLICTWFIAGAALAAKLMLPPMTEKVLPNGLKVIIARNSEQPVIAMRLVVKSGTCLDPAGKPGVAAMTARLLRQGTTTRDANRISEEIDFVGGELGASADIDASNVFAEILTKHVDIGLDLLADIVLNPAFPAAEIERDRKQTMAGLIQEKDEPEAICSHQYDKYLFGEHPYAQPSNGTVESVGTITRDDLVGFWQKNYVPNNAVLMVVGDADVAVVMPKIEAKFGAWRSGTPPVMNFAAAPPPTGMKIILINKPDATQSNIKIGHLGIDRYSPDIYSCRLMNYILGGGGFVSRMMADIRAKRGLTYDINSQFSYNRFQGDFTVSTFTRTDSTAKAILASIDHLNRMRDTDVSAEELAEAQSFYAGYFPRQFETNDQVAQQLSIVELYGLGKDYLPDYIDNVGKVSAAAIRQSAQKYLHPQDLLIVVVGKADALRESLKKLAPVTELDLVDL